MSTGLNTCRLFTTHRYFIYLIKATKAADDWTELSFYCKIILVLRIFLEKTEPGVLSK
jgi:hypothetical protein